MVQNFISAHGFFSAYPTLIKLNCGLVNPMAYAPQQVMTPRVEGCLEKYAGCEFDIQWHPYAWELSRMNEERREHNEEAKVHSCHYDILYSEVHI